MNPSRRKNVAVIGAGWAGMAAALGAARAGHGVTVMEAARTLGGRARAVHCADARGNPLVLDNGQHILIGAYGECLRLMREVGVDPHAAMLRMPLSLRHADGSGLRLPDCAPPWDALIGIARARGWSAGERIALLKRAAAWRLEGFRCADADSVADICGGLPRKLMDEFIDPLCVSALNTVAAQSSARVFLRVIQDSLFSGRGGSNMLLPRVDLGELFPAPAARWLQARGHQVLSGHRVQDMQPAQAAHGHARWLVDGQPFDAVILATAPLEAARLVQGAAGRHPHPCSLHAWARTAQVLRFSAIATVYAQTRDTHPARLAAPMLALRPRAGQPAQFVFDRGQLGGPPGLLAFVVSAFEGEREALAGQVLAQAAAQLAMDGLAHVQTVVEKRATFCCTPGLVRPSMEIAPGLLACGDYVDGPYPATLEGAVLHGS
ncbi:hydroxysqualene dehydroxylase HpnE, partial [Diaphorobacter ruginosibacter]|uniref:hydroxysqualene dehydroxylase HpnE n=1 Tax=Diaphorobacter ruginosibacter TaxID=1715720 RepID=UPI003341F263